MKFFVKNSSQKGGTPQKQKRRIPLVRRFVSVDGERTLFVETPSPESPKTPRTLGCSDVTASSSFRSLLVCGNAMDQVTQEPATVPLRHELLQLPPYCMQMYDSYSRAIKTALLLDEEDETPVMVKDETDETNIVEDDSIDYDLINRLNKSDTDLMESEMSPGALRLTSEGLKRHERKTLKDSFHDAMLASTKSLPVGLLAFRKEHERQQRQRELHDQQTVLQSNVTPEQSPQVVTPPQQDKKGIFCRLKKKRDSTAKMTTKQVQAQHSDVEFREQVRIANMRQKEILRQRQREAEAKRNLPSKIMNADETGLADEAGIEVMNEPMLKREKRPSSGTTPKLSTSVKDMPCIVCGSQERTHIAVPCMHFSFCKSCARNLSAHGWDCPVCDTPRTTYNQVFA